jgi:hypothetical protein
MAHKLVEFPVIMERSLDEESLIRVNRIRMRVIRMKKTQEEIRSGNGN